MKRKYVFALLFFLVLFSLSGEEMNQILEWEANPAALEYKVVIFRGNTPVLEMYTEETRVEFQLDPGIYRYTITIINKFRSESGVSSGNLRVEQVPDPLLKDIFPEEFFLDESPITVNLQAYQVFESASFILVGDGAEPRIEGLLVQIQDHIYELQFQIGEDVPPGNYRLEVVNPAGAVALSEETLVLKERLQPHLDSMGREVGYIGEVYTRLTVNGSGFEEGTDLYFQRGDRILYPVDVEYFSENQLYLWLDLREEERANYDVVIRNPSGGEVIAEKAFKVDHSPEYYWKERNFGSDLILSAIAIPSVEKDWWPYWGAEVKYNLDFTDQRPFWRWFGFEAKVGWIYLDKMEGFSLHGGCGLYLRTRFDFPVNLLLKGGLGGQWLNSDQFSGNGPYFMTAAALDVNFFRNLFFQIEGGLHYVLFADQYVLLLSCGLSVGYRF